MVTSVKQAKAIGAIRREVREAQAVVFSMKDGQVAKTVKMAVGLAYCDLARLYDKKG